MKQVLVMAKIGRPIKFVIRLTPEERTWLEGMIHCGIGLIRRFVQPITLRENI